MAIFTDPLAIGKVTTAEQPFTIQRGNETIELSEGDFIYLDDMISAGGTAVDLPRGCLAAARHSQGRVPRPAADLDINL